MMRIPVLYSFRRCPYAMRARLALDASAQCCEIREVVLRNKPAELLQASPKGTVPVLVQIDGAVIDQSLEIMLWSLQRSDPEHWLTPQRGSLADMLELISRFDIEFKANLDRYKYPARFGDVDPILHRELASQSLSTLEHRLRESRYLFGDVPTLGDMAIMPFIRQFANVSPDWFARQPWGKLQAWLATLQQSARFVRIMRPLPPWESGTTGVRFPFDD